MPLVGFALGFGLLRTVALAYFVGGACEFEYIESLAEFSERIEAQ